MSVRSLGRGHMIRVCTHRANLIVFQSGNLGCPVHVTGRTKKIINQEANRPLLCSAPARKWLAIPGHPGSPAITNQGEVWSAWAPRARAGGTINFAHSKQVVQIETSCLATRLNLTSKKLILRVSYSYLNIAVLYSCKIDNYKDVYTLTY